MSANLSEDQLDEAREAFKLADKTSSGSISTKEAPVMKIIYSNYISSSKLCYCQMVMRALGLDPSDDEISRMLEGRGETLTFQTFLSLVGERMNEVVDNEELRVAFSVFDRDNQEAIRSIIVRSNIFTLPVQGWLSGAELRFMLANLGEKLSFEEVDMLLQEAGIDNEGKFNYNDFIRKLNNSQ